jgi:hypothetical protein
VIKKLFKKLTVESGGTASLQNGKSACSLGFETGLPDLSWYNIPKLKKIPNNHEIYQITVKYTKWPQNIPNSHKIYQHLSLQVLQILPKLGFWLPSGNPGLKPFPNPETVL